jgi:hypothetical protein
MMRKMAKNLEQLESFNSGHCGGTHIDEGHENGPKTAFCYHNYFQPRPLLKIFISSDEFSHEKSGEKLCFYKRVLRLIAGACLCDDWPLTPKSFPICDFSDSSYDQDMSKHLSGSKNITGGARVKS